MGCPRCGSARLTQTRHTTGAGWGLFLLGAVGGMIFCWPALLILIAIFLNEWRGKCLDSGWSWRP